MSTITREWLQQTIAEYEANRDELPFGLDTNSAIELQAFKLALAALEAEPVGFIVRNKETGQFGNWMHSKADWFKDDGYEVLNAYIAQPAPVSVPDQWSKSLQEMVDAMRQYEMDVDEDAPHKHRAMMRRAEELLANRAAMLQGADGNSPVIPGGWKLVPIDPTKDMLRAGQSVVGFWLNTVHCYSEMLAAAPAAPQQDEGKIKR